MLNGDSAPTRERHSFSRIHASIPLPDLIEVQHRSYERFLQKDVQPADREEIGLQAVFRSIFPITDFRENCELEFLEYSVGNWACSCGDLEGIHHKEDETVCGYCGDRVHLKVEHDVEQCQQRGKTFGVPLRVKIRLTIWDRDTDTNLKSIHDIKEEEVFFGDIPLMTENGTFIINGTERVVVSQLHRSPGVFFKNPERGVHVAQVVPYRGSWLEFETDDQKGLLQVRIDRKKRFPATVLLRALGLGKTETILERFSTIQQAEILDPAGKLRREIEDLETEERKLEKSVATRKAALVETEKEKKAIEDRMAAGENELENLKSEQKRLSLSKELLKDKKSLAEIQKKIKEIKKDPDKDEKTLVATRKRLKSARAELQRLADTPIKLRIPWNENLKALLRGQRIELPLQSGDEVLVEGSRRIGSRELRTLDRRSPSHLDFNIKALGGFRLARPVKAPEDPQITVFREKVASLGEEKKKLPKRKARKESDLKKFKERGEKAREEIASIQAEVRRARRALRKLEEAARPEDVEAEGDNEASKTVPPDNVPIKEAKAGLSELQKRLKSVREEAKKIEARKGDLAKEVKEIEGRLSEIRRLVKSREKEIEALNPSDEIPANTPIDEALLIELQGLDTLPVIVPHADPVGPYVAETLDKDPLTRLRDSESPNAESVEGALVELYRRQRPGDQPTIESSRTLLRNLFFNEQKYDLSRVGRRKLAAKLGDLADALECPMDPSSTTLTEKDIILVLQYLLRLSKGKEDGYRVDDIDNLGNRRVRSVGELLENQFRLGLVRMERAIREKMNVYQEMTTAMPRDLINAKPVSASVREFFGGSQLSQFMEQTNPLAEITHKRRLSALGPQGLSRERAKFDVRDVHATHYGRICPIETPEGPNIGLISSLSCYAKIDDYGFIQSPYRKVEDGRIVDYVRVEDPGDAKLEAGAVLRREEAEKAASRLGKRRRQPTLAPHAFYLSALEEERHTIAQANARIGSSGELLDERVNCRHEGEFVPAPREQVDFIDVSPKQIVSVAAALVPFLENDDANRALMGSNMQRQAVPLVHSEAPLVGTGMEHVTARDSGSVIVSRENGVVDTVDGRRIIVRRDGDDDAEVDIGASIYRLKKFRRSNQNTAINQKVIVGIGDRVTKGQVIADGPCTDQGELALGRNVLVAFMPWRGYNFEDAIVVSERLVRDDVYTSIHIEEHSVQARDTKLGPETITREVPNVAESFLRHLDESGIVRIGARVSPGDILVGRVTPKAETQLTPEEKLLRAIFGDKAGDVKNSSLKCPSGVEGVVVDVRVFHRKDADKDQRAIEIESEDVTTIDRDHQDEARILKEEADKRIVRRMLGARLIEDCMNPATGEVEIPKGTRLTARLLGNKMDFVPLLETDLGPEARDEIQEIHEKTEEQLELLDVRCQEQKDIASQGDDLPPGVIKVVKVYIAMKRKLSVGDKMAGRHGNKGVIAKIVPMEDLPYLPDGTPVDIVLNPLGVPSRMNIGQILETHLGWIARVLGRNFATPVFDGALEEDIFGLLDEANEMARKTQPFRPNVLDEGKTELFDGRTGEPFEQPVTVGYVYMLKLGHLVDDKMHARSIGPYSLITQQPLGGKAQFGGQRFGEMEVWAIEAYGAAHTLQEILTVKSDDVRGRARVYEAIVKGDTGYAPEVPASFKVLMAELQSLGLDIELIRSRN